MFDLHKGRLAGITRHGTRLLTESQGEQMLRRKVEDELRALKKAQGSGKSPLTPR